MKNQISTNLCLTVTFLMIAGCSVTAAPPSQHLVRYESVEILIPRAISNCKQLKELSSLTDRERQELCAARYDRYGEYANRCVSHYLGHRLPVLMAEKDASGRFKYSGLSKALVAEPNSYYPKYSIYLDDPKTSINLASELHIDVRPACVLRERPKFLPVGVKSFSELSSDEKLQWKPFNHGAEYTNIDLTP